MNITEAKALFFAQYYMQEVFIEPMMGKKPNYFNGANIDDHGDDNYLLLRTVEQLTDEEIIQIAKLAHQMPNSDFIIKRDHDIIHAEHLNKIGIEYHISLYKNYGTVNANIHFSKTKDEPSKTFKANIGETTFSSRLPVPYIAICDYMRALGVLLQFTYLNEENKPVTLSPDEIIKLGWVKIKE